MSLADKFFTVLGCLIVGIVMLPVLFIAGYVISGIVSIIPDIVWTILFCFIVLHLLKRN